MICPDAETLAACDPAIEGHLAECADCRRIADTLRGGDDEPLPAGPARGDPEPGDNLGRYVILARLGVGGMGVVSSAYDPVLDRTVALKSIRADRVSADLARRFEREAQSLAKLAHPHLVRVFDAGVDRGRLYLAMELVEGVTLGAWLDKQQRETADIVRVFREVAQALACVHAAGLVHRDVKPENILVDAKGAARLADFGLVAPTATAEVVGTPTFMSPEQVRGAAVDARSDQWSWATTLAGVLGDRSVPRVRRVIDRATDADPAKRYPDMQAIVDALMPRRAVWPFAVAGVVAAAGITFAIVQRGGDECSAKRDGSWDREAPAIAKAFAASGHASWRARFDATKRAIAQATTALDDTTVAACKRADATDRSAAHEYACLADRRGEVHALLAELTRADRASVDQAPLAATRLSRGIECLDSGNVAIDPAAAKPLAAELKTLRAKFAVRGPREVVGDLGALAKRATDLGATQLEGEAKLLLGELQSRMRDDELAAATLGEAAQAAARARDDRVVALARLLQAGQAALLTTNPERAKALGEVAIAAVERAGNPVELRAQLENVLGGLAFSRGAFGDAEKHYRACLAARTEAFGAEDPRTAAAHQNIGIALGRLDRADDARAALETAVAILERTVGTDHPDLAVPLNSLGTNAADAKRFDDATKHFERALALRIATFGPDHPDVAVSHNNLGKLAKLRGQPRDGIAHYTRSLAIVEGKLGKDAAEVAMPLSGLAALHADLGEWEIARPHSERAIEITEAKRGKEHPALISILTTYANVLDHTGEPAKAREVRERVEALKKRQ